MVANACVLNERIPIAEPEFGANELKYVTECLESGWISSIGPFVERFEQSIARFCGARHAIATANGTVALHLALAALGIGKGDEVIVPAMTFIATANAVHYTGASIVLVDVDSETWNIDPVAVERAVTRRTKAIVPVHLYGLPCDMDALRRIAKRHRLFLVEDAAESLGATYKGTQTGVIGDIGTFSFYANKTLTTGEGGMCLTNNNRLAARMRHLRDHAMSKTRRYYHPEIGFNYRITALQAAIGVAQAERLEELLERKRQIAGWYDAALAGIPGLVLPARRNGLVSSNWMYSVLVLPAFGMSRDALAAALREQGIDTRPFFWALHEQPPYRTSFRAKRGRALPVAARLARQGLSLPSASTLRLEQARIVAATIRSLARPLRSRRVARKE